MMSACYILTRCIITRPDGRGLSSQSTGVVQLYVMDFAVPINVEQPGHPSGQGLDGHRHASSCDNLVNMFKGEQTVVGFGLLGVIIHASEFY